MINYIQPCEEMCYKCTNSGWLIRVDAETMLLENQKFCSGSLIAISPLFIILNKGSSTGFNSKAIAYSKAIFFDDTSYCLLRNCSKNKLPIGKRSHRFYHYHKEMWNR